MEHCKKHLTDNSQIRQGHEKLEKTNELLKIRGNQEGTMIKCDVISWTRL